MSYALIRPGRVPKPPAPPPPPAAPAEPQREERALARTLAPRAPRYAFWLLVVFLVLEYARPPGIVQLKIQMLITMILPLAFLRVPKRPWSQILTVQLIFFLWVVKSIPIAYNYFAVYFTARTLYGSLATAIAFTWVCSHMRDLRPILWVYLAVMAYQALFAVTHGGKGTGGFLGDENDLALACCTAFPLAFFGFEGLKGVGRWLCGAAMVLLISAVVVSISRGGFVGLACCGLYCWLASRHKIRALALIVLAVVLVPVFAPPNYVDEIRSIAQTNEGTAKGRRFLWQSAVNMWQAHPILGVGGGNATFLIGRYQPNDFEEREYNERDWSGMAMHSFYFQLLPEHGAVGVALVAFLIWKHFGINRRLIRDVGRSRSVPPGLRRDTLLYARALNGMLIAFLAAGTFLSVAYYPYLWYFTALSAALDLAVRRELPRGTARTSAPQPALP